MKKETELTLDSQSILEKVSHWSRVFGLPMRTAAEFPSPDRISLSLKLIREELRETEEAIAFKDYKETKDGLGDLLWVTIRAMYEFGIDPEEVIDSIYKSNMSKADTNQEDALLTHKKYMEQGIHTYCKEVQGMFITYRSSDNKVLKSYLFKEPEL
jgi:NTP pyrophosphatase (non-canonical NTP hydrolase)